MDDALSPPVSARPKTEEKMPQLLRTRTNSLPSAESENTAQLPAATLPRDPLIQPMPQSGIIMPITSMSQIPGSNPPSDLSITSTVIPSTDISEEPMLQDMNKLGEVSTCLERQASLNVELETKYGMLEENHRLREQVKSSTAGIQSIEGNAGKVNQQVDERLELCISENQNLREILKQKDSDYDLLVTEVGQQIHELNKKITSLKNQKQEHQNIIIQLEKNTKDEGNARKREQFNKEIKLNLFEARCTEQSARILDLEGELETLKRTADDKCSEVYKKLEESNIICAGRQQAHKIVRRELKSTLSEFNGKFLAMTYKNNELKDQIEKHETQVLQLKRRNSRLESEAKAHEAERKKNSRDLESMKEVVQISLGRVMTAEAASDNFKVDYQRERQWRETAEKSAARLEKELTAHKHDLKVANNICAAQRKKEVKMDKDAEKIRRNFDEEVQELKREIKFQNVDLEITNEALERVERTISVLYCVTFILVVIILAGACSGIYRTIRSRWSLIE
jgi:hypothetical protein